MPHHCLSRLAAAIAACLILFISLPVSLTVRAEGNILRAAQGGATSGSCGADWARPCDLQYALSTLAQPGDEIWVKAGTYYPTTNPSDRNASFVLRDGVSLYGGFAGTETERSQRHWVAHPTILSGDIDHNDLASPAQRAEQIQGANSLHVVYGTNVSADAVLDGFVITAGQALNSPVYDDNGGAVKIALMWTPQPGSGRVRISNVHIMGSRARDGGCVYIDDTGVLTDALVTGCTADAIGGGIHVYGFPILTRVIISGNTAQRGGGMGINYGSPVITDLTFTNNTASLFGGGLYADYANPPITGTVFQDNFAGKGGGGAYLYNANPEIIGSTFENNRTNGNGGGIFSHYNILLRDCLLANNSALNGGGIYFFEGDLDLTNVTINGNTASQEGGGLWASYGDQLQFENVTFESNTAVNDGGGAWVSSFVTQIKGGIFIDNVAGGWGGGLIVNDFEFLLSGGLFHGNQAAMGGGLYLSGDNQQVENVTFIENSAISKGGAILIESNDSGDPCILRHLTIVGNEANTGGGISNENGGSGICKSILWNNTPDQISEVYRGGPGNQFVVEQSIVEGGYVWGGVGIITADPLLAPLGSYGGGTQTYALLPGSPAIDAGDAAYCPDADQRGVSRPQGAGCDIGAFESRGFTLAIAGGENQSAVIGQPFFQPLTVTVSSAVNEPVKGGQVTFTPPMSGASASISGSPAAITAAGSAQGTALANDRSGAYTVTAGGAGITPVNFHLTNLPILATIEVSVTKSPLVYGEPLTFRAQVTASTGMPSGKVQFRLDGADIGSPVDLSGGWAEHIIDTFVSTGTHKLTAAYLGSQSHQAALTGQPVDVIVQKAGTAVTLSSTASPALPYETIVLTADVEALSPGRGQPTGSVIFNIDDEIETTASMVDGAASLTLPPLYVGSHTITATYTGDENYLASPADSFTQRVHYFVPIITALDPSMVHEDSSGFTLTITGTGISPSAVARWNGNELPTVAVDVTTLTVDIPAGLLETPGAAQITVFNPQPGGGESNAVIFTVLERMRLYLPVVFGQ